MRHCRFKARYFQDVFFHPVLFVVVILLIEANVRIREVDALIFTTLSMMAFVTILTLLLLFLFDYVLLCLLFAF